MRKIIMIIAMFVCLFVSLVNGVTVVQPIKPNQYPSNPNIMTPTYNMTTINNIITQNITNNITQVINNISYNNITINYSYYYSVGGWINTTKNTSTDLNVTIFGTLTTTDQITVNYNPSIPLTAGLTGTGVRINGNDNTSHRIAITSYGTGGSNAFSGRHARGNGTNPLSVQSNDVLASFEGYGRVNSSVWSGIPHAYIRLYADNTWNATYRPTFIDFYVTGYSSILPFKVMKLQSNGEVNITSNLTVQDTIRANNINSTSITVNDLTVTGSFASRRAYAMLSDNTTQTVAVTNTPYPINISIIEDSYLVNVDANKRNLSVNDSGDYLMILSVSAVSSSPNSHLEIWLQKNGLNVPRSNSRYEFKSSNAEAIITVPFIIDVLPTDKFNFAYAGDSTGIQLVTYGNTSYSPQVPAIILTITKMSEIP